MAATTTIYDELTEHLGISPEPDEDEQAFLTRLFRAANALDEEKWDELSETAALWCNDASDAVTAKKPIQACPGAPFTNGADAEGDAEEEEAPPPRRRAAAKTSATKEDTKRAAKPAAKPATGKKTAAAAETKATAKPAAKAAAKPAADKKAATPKKTATPRAPGVLDLLMEATYHNPSDTPLQLQARVKAANPNMEVKLANAVGIRQQYRRIVRFLQAKGHVKDLKTE